MFRKKTITSRRRPNGRAATEAPTRRPNVFSYRASRSAVADNLGRGEAKETVRRPKLSGKHRLSKLLRIVLIAIIMAFIGKNLLLTNNVDIVLLDPANTVRDSSVYYNAAVQAFTSSKLNSNKITVNAVGVEQSLKRAFPELADVSISLPVIGQKPVVFLQPSTSRLIVQTANGPFVVDESGKAIANGPIIDKLRQAGLPEVHDESGLDIKLGSSVLPSTAVSYITEVGYQLKAKNLAIESLRLPNTPSELHLRVQGVGYYIKLNTRGDARVAVGSFIALKQHLELQQKVPAEYIDVRTELRAYYK